MGKKAPYTGEERRVDMAALATNVGILVERTENIVGDIGNIWQGVSRINGTLGDHRERIGILETCFRTHDDVMGKVVKWQDNLKTIIAIVAGISFAAGTIFGLVAKYLL